jgi:uncharacterized damage-inducible protein DinB
MRGMNLADLNTWLDYHYWARDVILDAVAPLNAEQFTRPIESSFKSVRDTVAHMYGAEWLWYNRWTGQLDASMPKYDSWPDLTSIKKAWRDHEVRVRTLVNDGGEAGVSRVYNYKSLAGQPTSSQFWEMLVHVVNHGSYHRGQVTTLLRQLGAQPPKQTDMIAFFRMRAQK